MSEKPFSERTCQPCKGSTPPKAEGEIRAWLPQLSDWEYTDGELVRTVTFKNYYETSSFVNAVIWIAHREDHHPNISFGYKTCTVRYSTHAIGGLSENDFICAAKIDALLG